MVEGGKVGVNLKTHKPFIPFFVAYFFFAVYGANDLLRSGSFHSNLGVLVLLVLMLVRAQMLGQSSTLGGAQYHESRWLYFLDWDSQMLFHLGSVLLFGIVVSLG